MNVSVSVKRIALRAGQSSDRQYLLTAAGGKQFGALMAVNYWHMPFGAISCL
jgi:hypothetical protein